MKILARYWLECICALMLAASVYFFVGATNYRRSISNHDVAAFANNDRVQIVEVIDGDKVVVSKGDSRAVLRLEGLEAFEATASDPLLAEYGQIARHALFADVSDKAVRLLLADKKLDLKGRLLGRLELEEPDGATVDPAENLIAHGYAITYTRFPTPHQDHYLTVERTARQAKRGLWANDYLTSRVDAMRIRWEEEANRD